MTIHIVIVKRKRGRGREEEMMEEDWY